MSDTALSFEDRRTAPRSSLVDAAYHAIKTSIRDGLFPPGFQGSELEIAERLGMSRTPVHQAIIQLQAEGMVDLRTKRGVVICALSPDDMREVYDVIVAVEGMAAFLIASLPEERREPICLRLAALTAAGEAALEDDDLEVWAAKDGEFHAALIEEAGNGRLKRIATVNLDQSHRARRLTLNLRPKPTPSIGEHRAIIAALSAGRPEDARRAAQAHKENARDLIMAILKRYDMRYL
ncbi:GntR family transcriptional regulator [Fulvimarina sp. MAC3]|uniref:GntR family transcriptional regulator n=1 Tax=Fulvimarina sp. MAC3 TaxID=3148887 RepID=UPI0031FBD069